jgi:hypothetical protein
MASADSLQPMKNAIGRKWTAEQKKEARLRGWIRANHDIIDYLMSHPNMATDLRAKIINCFF